MDLSLYDVIVGPIISDKAYRLNKKLNKLMLKVHPQANKPMVKEALEKLFNVKVDRINIVIHKGKLKRVRGKMSQGSVMKKAVITLAQGHTLNLFDQAGTHAVAEAQPKHEKAKE